MRRLRDTVGLRSQRVNEASARRGGLAKPEREEALVRSSGLAKPEEVIGSSRERECARGAELEQPAVEI